MALKTLIASNVAVSLTTLDVSFFLLTLALSVLIGIYFSNKNGTLDEYMLGGRSQKLWPVSISLMTSFCSGLTLIGAPADTYYYGLGYTVFGFASMFTVPICAFILLPVFHRLGGVSVYGYLEQRFHPVVKQMVSIVFIVQMVVYNAVVLYVPSLSLESVLGISEIISIGCVGLSCIIYATLGGIKAVIWTDFYQAGLMFLALIFIAVGGTIDEGGLSRIIEVGVRADRFNPDEVLRFDATSRYTLFNTLTAGVIISTFINGANQIQVQRSLSLPTLRQIQWSQVISTSIIVVWSTLSCYLGLILLSAYEKCDPFENKQIDKPDAILIYYIGTHLEHLPGLRGIFVAGIFAATLSTLSSFQNSMSALVLEDFIKPSLKRPLSDKSTMLLSKSLAFMFGVICVAVTFVVGRISGLMEAAMSLFGCIGAPLVAAFFLGMMTRFVNSKGMFVGMIAGWAVGISLQLNHTFFTPPLLPTMPISTAMCPATANFTLTSMMIQTDAATQLDVGFVWGRLSYCVIALLGFLVTVLVSALVSVMTGGCRQQVADKYLVSWLHRGPEFDSDDYSVDRK